MLHVLLVDDELPVRALLQSTLTAQGYRVDAAATARDALGMVRAHAFDVVLSNVPLPGAEPRTIVRRITRPLELDLLLDELRTIAAQRSLEAPGARAAGADASSGAARIGETHLVGQSPMMTALRRRIEMISRSSCSALITGESGTGKELVARMIHERSDRRKGPFVVVNCAAIPESLFDAEFFGHERGAFTGAVRRRAGHFQAADRGTLVLDEIGELSPAGQAKLLRALQDGVFHRIGSDRPAHSDVRVLAATNRDLGQMILQGQFREDLLYRLNVVTLEVPALRQRRGDLSLLVAYFIEALREPGGRCPSITPRAWAALRGYAYPGNVRELEHLIQHALIMSGGDDIDLEHLPDTLRGTTIDPTVVMPREILSLHQAVSEFEQEYIRRVLDSVGGCRTKAAELLGVSRKTLWEKLRVDPALAATAAGTEVPDATGAGVELATVAPKGTGHPRTPAS